MVRPLDEKLLGPCPRCGLHHDNSPCPRCGYSTEDLSGEPVGPRCIHPDCQAYLFGGVCGWCRREQEVEKRNGKKP